MAWHGKIAGNLMSLGRPGTFEKQNSQRSGGVCLKQLSVMKHINPAEALGLML